MDFLKMSIQDLGKLKDELIGKAQAIDALAKSENRDLTDAENTEADKHLSQVDEINKHLAARTRRDARSQRISQLTGAASTAAATGGAPIITGVKASFEDDPKKGFKNRQEYFTAVMNAGITGECRDERLAYLAAVGGDEHSTSNDAFGGYLVPEGISGGLQMVDPEVDFLSGLVTRMPMATNRMYLNARVDKNHSDSVTGGLRVYRNAETQTVDASRMSTERVYFNAESLMGIAYASEEILADSPISFAAIVGQSFAQELSSRIMNERFNGTGVGEFEGVLNCPATVSVAKESGQKADTVLFENIVKMYSRCYGKDRAVWVANHNVLPQLLLMNQNVGTAGVPAWQPSAREGAPNTLLGRPIYFTEYCKTLGDNGDIILGDWSQYVEATRQGVSAAESVHVRFIYNERAFRFTMRNDGKCWWRSALTPKNGDTLSPFVTLAARA